MLGLEIAKYRLTRLLGQGGMGRVYLGVHGQIGSRVAIKLLAPEHVQSPEIVQRFFDEARAVNLIHHEHIVDVIDLDRLADGTPYIVMEYVEGASLATLLRAGRLPLAALAALMGEVLAALGAAHAAGVVHRDLKPDNVMVTPAGHAKVMDFGIAKLAAGVPTARDSRTRTGAAVGTPEYMAPEQIRGGAVDARTDLYAVGVMLYELATGTRPFRAESDFELFEQHLGAEPRDVRDLRPEIPPAMWDVIRQALAKRPEERFANAQAMARALVHALPRDDESWLVFLAAARARDAQTKPERALPEGGRLEGPTQSLQRGASPPPVERQQKWGGRTLSIAAAAGLASLTTYLVVSGTNVPASHRTDDAVTTVAAAADDALSVTPGPSKDISAPSPVHDVSLPHRIVTGPTDAAPLLDTASPRTVEHPASTPGQPIEGFEQSAKRRTLAADYDVHHFSGTSYLATARRLARELLPDAELVAMTLGDVRADGLIDLQSGGASYTFRSPAASKPLSIPAGEPGNASRLRDCLVEVYAHADNVSLELRSSRACDERVIVPRCGAAAWHRRAVADGMPASFQVTIYWAFAGRSTVRIVADDWDGQHEYPDDCPL